MMNRREVLKSTFLTTGYAAGLRFLGPLSGVAQTTGFSDYRALICIFLGGGNDSNNMVVPLDSSGYATYALGRSSLALTQNSLLPLKAIDFGLHPSMPELQALINSNEACIVANMGPLVQPVTASQIMNQTAVLPQNLESHPDQQSLMQTALGVSGSTQGWGGRLADVLSQRDSSNLPLAVSFSGNTPFTNGQTSGFVAPSPGGVPCSQGGLCPSRTSAAQALLGLPSGVLLVQADQAIYQSMYAYITTYANDLAGVSNLSSQFPATSLGGQLASAATLISARGSVGAHRQIFFVTAGSFDTHASQLDTQATLLAQVSAAIGAFRNWGVSAGVWQDITLFTASEFSRTLQPNSVAGSDHAWGGHHLVAGGSVKGGAMYGKFPDLTLGGPDDFQGRGQFVPTTSITQVAATIATWMGVPSGDLPKVLPLINNFPTANLGFL